MKSIVLSIALAASALALSFVGASAQGVGVEIYAGPGYYDTPYYYSPSYTERRAYRYYSDPDDVDVKVRRSGGCGTYFYWDGETCVDARRRRSSGY